MNFKELRDLFISEGAEIYNQEEASALFYRMLDQLLGWSRTKVMTHLDKDIEASDLSKYLKVLEKLKAGQPIQYIFEETWFYGFPFKVNSAVLIPRPETEELVHWIIEVLKGRNGGSLLDIGTGSGCIAVALKKSLDGFHVSALDISADALEVAQYNASINKVVVNFIEADILAYSGTESFDLIVSNPPYIKEDEKPEMHENVLAHEPHGALFVSNENPLIFYKAIADFALVHLNPQGLLFFEINEYLGKETVDMLGFKGFKQITLKKDMQGKDRMVSCMR
ncbi:peptide chain release factor N(5)-glutamine methyltransferase [Pedobacter sp.]|jgi:release factor glutamine methyltransferase|uniref:peptide chain release factor N(5)-glutamine methyltransferase n=1 Tax=Pedobacter sp. TaxID=1411316 RepID=UPI002CA139BD|nr:peptide chain release factor N(5)-glutamine methyltransferase [Pedobacter sp.]HWW37946.1 peptide chain release factor N(5)-glutamine methyltransferase [Pedobacter sp.]